MWTEWGKEASIDMDRGEWIGGGGKCSRLEERRVRWKVLVGKAGEGYALRKFLERK
jgi:hypothetical protein